MTEFTQDAIDRSAVGGSLPTPHFLPTDGQTHAFTLEQARDLKSGVEQRWGRRADFAPMGINITNLRNLSAEQIRSLTYPHQDCVFATSQVVISPYGHVLPCLYFSDYHLGDLKVDSVQSSWSSAAHRAFCDAQQGQEIGICSLCSNKSYHKTLGPALREAAGNAGEKLRRLVG